MEESLFNKVIASLKQFPSNKNYDYELVGGGMTAFLVNHFFDKKISVKDVDIDIFAHDCPSLYSGGIDKKRLDKSSEKITNDFISFLSEQLEGHRVEFSHVQGGTEGITIDGERCINLLINQKMEETDKFIVGGINISDLTQHICNEEYNYDYIDTMILERREGCLDPDSKRREMYLTAFEKSIWKKVRLEERRPYLLRLKEIIEISPIKRVVIPVDKAVEYQYDASQFPETPFSYSFPDYPREIRKKIISMFPRIRRGDIVSDSRKADRNEMTAIFDGNDIVDLDDSFGGGYGHVPINFTTNEFPIDYWSNVIFYNNLNFIPYNEEEFMNNIKVIDGIYDSESTVNGITFKFDSGNLESIKDSAEEFGVIAVDNSYGNLSSWC